MSKLVPSVGVKRNFANLSEAVFVINLECFILDKVKPEQTVSCCFRLPIKLH